MKKILFFAIAALFALASCANDKPIEPSELPAEAQNFLKTHFAAQKIALATVDREFTHTSYEVQFADGGSVEFDGKGHWKDVECGTLAGVSTVSGTTAAAFSAVPDAIVPAEIKAHIAANYPGMVVRQINRERHSWEVDLVAALGAGDSVAGAPAAQARTRSLELKFDSAFRLVEIDD